jgi:hypothetical protein
MPILQPVVFSQHCQRTISFGTLPDPQYTSADNHKEQVIIIIGISDQLHFPALTIAYGWKWQFLWMCMPFTEIVAGRLTLSPCAADRFLVKPSRSEETESATPVHLDWFGYLIYHNVSTMDNVSTEQNASAFQLRGTNLCVLEHLT